MSWLNVLRSVAFLITRLLDRIAGWRAFRAGQDHQAAETLKEQQTRVEKARAARRGVGDDTDRLHEDPYRRD